VAVGMAVSCRLAEFSAALALAYSPPVIFSVAIGVKSSCEAGYLRPAGVCARWFSSRAPAESAWAATSAQILRK